MKIKRILCFAILSTSIVFTIFFAPSMLWSNSKIEQTKKCEFILSLWHIDTFEGGTGSRNKFLNSVARKFEKQNKNVLVFSTVHTIDSAKYNIENGVYPDLISFGNGCEIAGLKEIKINKDFNYGKILNAVFAVPWCRGGYALISDANKQPNLKEFNYAKNLIVSQGQYTQPLSAYLLEEFSASSVNIQTPLNAYILFNQNKIDYFLGTQRDIVRLSNRGREVQIRPLTYFNDLYQYIGVMCLDKDKFFYAEKFVNFILEKENQQKLSEICMFSCFYDIAFENPHLSLMQKTTFNASISPFLDCNTLKDLQQSAINALTDKNQLTKIKNLLI